MVMKILVIIPAYNEAKCILNTVNSLKEYMSVVDYIVINDGSTDETEQILKQDNINHITLIENLGIGGAVQTGYKYAFYHDYDYAIQYDGDGQHDAKYIPDLIEGCYEGNDIVVGSRFINNEGFQSTALRRIGIKLIAGTIHLLSGTKVTDTTSGFRIVNKEIIALFSKRYPDDFPESETTMMVLRQGYKFKEVPVIMKERVSGKSSISPFKSIYFIVKVMISIVFSFIINNKKAKELID